MSINSNENNLKNVKNVQNLFQDSFYNLKNLDSFKLKFQKIEIQGLSDNNINNFENLNYEKIFNGEENEILNLNLVEDAQNTKILERKYSFNSQIENDYLNFKEQFKLEKNEVFSNNKNTECKEVGKKDSGFNLLSLNSENISYVNNSKTNSSINLQYLNLKSNQVQTRLVSSSKFINTLYHILEIDELWIKDIISWSDDGAVVEIHNKQQLEEKILPQFYKHSSYSNFIRQLNMYNFRKIVNYKKTDTQKEHKDIVYYKNPNFIKNNIESIQSIERKKIPNYLIKQIQNSVNENEEEQENKSFTKTKKSISTLKTNKNTVSDNTVNNYLIFLSKKLEFLNQKVEAIETKIESFVELNKFFYQKLQEFSSIKSCIKD